MFVKKSMVADAIAAEMTAQPIGAARMVMPFSSSRTATVLFGLEREDHPGSVEDVVDVIAKFDAQLNTIHTSRQESSGQVWIYGNLEIDTGKISAFREQLGGFNEILYFKSIE